MNLLNFFRQTEKPLGKFERDKELLFLGAAGLHGSTNREQDGPALIRDTDFPAHSNLELLRQRASNENLLPILLRPLSLNPPPTSDSAQTGTKRPLLLPHLFSRAAGKGKKPLSCGNGELSIKPGSNQEGSSPFDLDDTGKEGRKSYYVVAPEDGFELWQIGLS